MKVSFLSEAKPKLSFGFRFFCSEFLFQKTSLQLLRWNASKLMCILCSKQNAPLVMVSSKFEVVVRWRNDRCFGGWRLSLHQNLWCDMKLVRIKHLYRCVAECCLKQRGIFLIVAKFEELVCCHVAGYIRAMRSSRGEQSCDVT